METTAPAQLPVSGTPVGAGRRFGAARFTVVALILAALWVVLNEVDPGSWIVGAPSILLGAWLACLLPPSTGWVRSPFGALRFAPFFLGQSLLGGWDVALRALRPSLPIAPAFLSYRTRLPPGAARVLFFDAITLLPGTLSAELDGDHVLVHAVDAGAAPREGLEDLERRVARLFGPEPGRT